MFCARGQIFPHGRDLQHCLASRIVGHRLSLCARLGSPLPVVCSTIHDWLVCHGSNLLVRLIQTDPLPDEDTLFTETDPPLTRGRRTVQTPTIHNGLSLCPAAAIRSSGTTAASRKSASG